MIRNGLLPLIVVVSMGIGPVGGIRNDDGALPDLSSARAGVQPGVIFPLEPPAVRSFSSGPCSASEFAEVPQSEIVDALSSASPTCLYNLWSFDDDVATLCDSTTVILVSLSLALMSGNLSESIPEAQNLLYFIRIAFYHQWYEGSIEYFPSAVSSAQGAVLLVGRSEGFTDLSAGHTKLRAYWASAIDSVESTHLSLPAVQWILNRYTSDPTLRSLYWEHIGVSRILRSFRRQIGNSNNHFGSESPWFELLNPSIVEAISVLALEPDYDTDTEYLVTNAVWTLGYLSYLEPAVSDAGRLHVTTAIDEHLDYSGPWVWSLKTLEQFYDSQIVGGATIDMDSIREEIHDEVLPVAVSFGTLHFQSGLTVAALILLNQSLGAVLSAFDSMLGPLVPVPGDENDELTLVVYGSRADYRRFQPFLFGLSTDNGGIYIEQWGTLFTYERTPQESVYTLEELLRHEYVHYLDARFNVSQEWGDGGSLYVESDIRWYVEGMAEFFAGATASHGVLPRRSIANRIISDVEKMTVSEVIAEPFTAKTYRYAGLFFNYIASEEPDLFSEIVDAVRSNDSVVVNELFDRVSNDPNTQEGYDLFLSDLISGESIYFDDVLGFNVVGLPAVGMPSMVLVCLMMYILNYRRVYSNGQD